MQRQKNFDKVSHVSSSLRVAGFTLIELLIVIAVIGVLAAIVLLAIDPVQQFARARDANRKQVVSTMGRALRAYATFHNSEYPPATGGGGWSVTIANSSEIKTFPESIPYNVSGLTPCTRNVVNGWCYGRTPNTKSFFYAKMESDAEHEKCASGEYAYYLWGSTENRTGTVCWTIGSDPTLNGYAFID